MSAQRDDNLPALIAELRVAHQSCTEATCPTVVVLDALAEAQRRLEKLERLYDAFERFGQSERQHAEVRAALAALRAPLLKEEVKP